MDCGLSPSPRPYQTEALAAFTQARFRLFCLLWERQSGKSSTFADMTLFEMMQRPWRTCIYASASLLLAQELPIKQSHRLHLSASQLIQKDSATLQAAALRCSAHAATAGLLFHTADAAKDKILPPLDPAAFAELFQAQKLEFRVYHDKSSYSRTKIIAPNLATARSWTGSVFLDEIAFIRDLKHLIVALLPVISTNKDLKLILATTPPEFDDSHYSFELLAPPPALAFTPNPVGNWYESQSQIPVHRADAFDTHLAGKKIFDLRSGAEITPAEALRRAPNKLGHRIAHHLAWIAGGAAACDLLRLTVAQERGAGHCAFFDIDSDADFLSALNWLAAHRDPAAKTALGFDPATTTKGASNPSALAIAESHPPDVLIRAILVWKTRDPDLARDRLRSIIQTLSRRPPPLPSRPSSLDTPPSGPWPAPNPSIIPPIPPIAPIPPSGLWTVDSALPTPQSALRPPQTVDSGPPAEASAQAGLCTMGSPPRTVDRGLWTVDSAPPRSPRSALHALHAPRALALDATNERYFAEDLRKQFATLLPVLLIVASESLQKPGLDKPTNWKEYLGDQYLALLHDNRLTLPPDDYVRADHRLVLKDRGRFVCEPDSLGRHGDTFDAAKLALHALTQTPQGITSTTGIYVGRHALPSPHFTPNHL